MECLPIAKALVARQCAVMPLHQQCYGVVGADVVGNDDDPGLVDRYGLGETALSTQPSDASADPIGVDVRPDLNNATDALDSGDEGSRNRGPGADRCRGS